MIVVYVWFGGAALSWPLSLRLLRNNGIESRGERGAFGFLLSLAWPFALVLGAVSFVGGTLDYFVNPDAKDKS